MANSVLLVLGIGNILLGDEGVGVRVAREVEALGADRLPPGTVVVDGGTLGLDLLPVLESAAAVVIVDAANLGAAPGTVRVLRDAELERALAQGVSPDQAGARELLAVARLAGVLPDRVALVAIQPERIETGLELTSGVEAAVPAAVDLIRRELEALASLHAPDRERAHDTATDPD